jgi:uncharacterized protein with PIN domain
MLGKLTRWLRMLGQDVIYSVQFDDSLLLDLAKRDERALLTKDFELYNRAIGRGLDVFYVEGKSESEQLARVTKRYGITLEINMDKSRCTLCNSTLKAKPKEQLLQGELKENTYKYYENFWKCPDCSQIYWQGAHWKQILKTLKQAKQKKLESK